MFYSDTYCFNMVLPSPTPTFSHIYPSNYLSSNFEHLLKSPNTHEVFSWEFEMEIQYSTFPKPWGLLIHKLDLGLILACSSLMLSMAHQTVTANIWLVTQPQEVFSFLRKLQIRLYGFFCVFFFAAIAVHILLLHALGIKMKPVVQFHCLHGKLYLKHVSSTQLFPGTSVCLNQIYRVK